MDTMKSLNTSLPRSSPKTQRQTRPSEELLQSFKNAALSVTNLYRAAEASERRAVQAGYQDALDDLLAFLDKENMGLGDGEGWRIRQWATERLEDHPSAQNTSDSEDEKLDVTQQTNHDRPIETQAQPSEEEMPLAASRQQSNAENGPAIEHSCPQPSKPSSAFTFRTPYQLAEENASMAGDNAESFQSPAQDTISSQPTPAVTLNIHSRASKSLRNSRQVSRSTGLRSLGSGAGSKRRTPFAEYFDLSELGNLKKSKLN